jgi:hypothetical protein
MPCNEKKITAWKDREAATHTRSKKKDEQLRTLFLPTGRRRLVTDGCKFLLVTAVLLLELASSTVFSFHCPLNGWSMDQPFFDLSLVEYIWYVG